MLKIGDMVRLRANLQLCGFITHIDNLGKNDFYYVFWLNHHNKAPSDFPYAPTSLVKVR